MARFAYVAVDADGKERTGALTASTDAEARVLLEKKRWLTVRVTLLSENARAQAPAKTVAQSPKGTRTRGPRLNHRDVALFARQLATLAEAGVPVDEALGLIAEQQEKPHACAIIADVQTGVLEGMRLADAMALHPRSFSGLFRAAVSGGERAGALGPVLGRLADYLARSNALRSKIVTALVYPAALSFVAVLVVACLMIFVVPPLTEQFRRFDAGLPLITQVLIAVSGFLVQYWVILLAAGALGFFALQAVLARPGPALARDRMMMQLPGFGRWIRALNASRFARAVSTLTASGLPVLDAVRAARESTQNRHFAALAGAMATRIEEGEPLSQAMRLSGVFPPLVVYMAASGEGAGTLPSMLEKASDHLDQEFESFSTAAMSLFEPAVILTMGAIVAGIVLAIMLPILQLNQLAIG
jgi:general secretion pathway protein F